MIFFSFRLFGTIPGPILYGNLIDKACVLSSGKCIFYNNYDMSVYLTVITCVTKCVSVLCFILALYTSKRYEIPEDLDFVAEVPSEKQTTQEFASTKNM